MNKPVHIATAEEHQEMMAIMHRIDEEERRPESKMKIYTDKVIKDIEERVLALYNLKCYDENKKAIRELLALRKDILDSHIVPDADNYYEDLMAFSNNLLDALRKLYDKSCNLFGNLSAQEEDDFDLTGTIHLDVADLYTDDCKDTILTILADSGIHTEYTNGCCICPIMLKKNDHIRPFREFIADDGKSWSEHLPSKCDDIPLPIQFHHLYDHTLWSLQDLLVINKFYKDIEINIYDN